MPQINHVSVNALNLEESVRFYEDLLGAKRIDTPNFGIPVQWLALGRTQLHIADRCDFGGHYAETLRLWRARFTARADQVRALGFDEEFLAMWTFYLCYSEAGFRSGYLDVCQLTLVKDR